MNFIIVLPIICLAGYIYSIDRKNTLHEAGYIRRREGMDFHQVYLEQEPKYQYWEKFGKFAIWTSMFATAGIALMQ